MSDDHQSCDDLKTYLEDITRMYHLKKRSDLEEKIAAAVERHKQALAEADDAQRTLWIYEDQLSIMNRRSNSLTSCNMRREEIIARYERTMRYLGELSSSADKPIVTAAEPITPITTHETTKQAPAFHKCCPVAEPQGTTIVVSYKIGNRWIIKVLTKDKQHTLRTNKVFCHVADANACKDDIVDGFWKGYVKHYLTKKDLNEYEYFYDDKIKAENPPSSMRGRIDLLIERTYPAINYSSPHYHEVSANWNGVALGYIEIAYAVIPSNVEQCEGAGDIFSVGVGWDHYGATIHRVNDKSDICCVIEDDIVTYIVEYRGDKAPLIMPVHPAYTVRKTRTK